ncbi:hypothetical protein H310_14229 [Aphanomyces invadans]|uniref:Uncharacterized protein n=1 Tax=Aphanomyces invadans TaxID=157072 RepID=A0A024TAU1_9STRA|nr:hypothetical protein H310_14229 [Aphanomyces invadans]ETV91134.1 hypothetical protein H310_14229 [Aphanomyces invadans]|eukprot:XP_008880261.1 hypothetical protein H310_14229 [Aphanomyces invadans]
MQPFVELVRRHKRSRRVSRHEAWFFRYTAHANDEDARPVEPHAWHAKHHLWQLASLQFTDLHEGDVNALNEALNVTCTLHQDSSGCTALHVAATHGHLDCVLRLLERPDARLQMHVKNEAGETALHSALRHSLAVRDRTNVPWAHEANRVLTANVLACVDALLGQATPTLLSNVYDKNGWSIEALDFRLRGDLFDAVVAGDVTRLRFILATYRPSALTLPALRRTLLHEACANRHVEATIEVLTNEKLCVNPLEPDTSGCTALHVCAKGGFVEGCVLLLDSDKMGSDTAETLLLASDATGRTALHWSIMHRHAAAALFLLHVAALHGVVVELLQRVDDADHSPLHVACATVRSEIDLVLTMIELGANVNLASRANLPRRSNLCRRSWPREGAGGVLANSPHDLPNRVKTALESTSLHAVSQHTVELKTMKLIVPRPPPPASVESSAPSIRATAATVRIPSPLKVALTARSYDIADCLVQSGADCTEADKVWEVFLRDPASRPTLAKWGALWLHSDVFAPGLFSALCCPWRLNTTCMASADDDTEQGLCALLELATSLGVYRTWRGVFDAAMSAFRCRRLRLAHQLLVLHASQGGNVFITGAQSWLCVAAENACLASCRWLQAHNYPFSVADSPAISALLSKRCRDRRAQDVEAAQTRTDVCLWLLEHFSELYQPAFQLHLDRAFANGYMAVAVALVAKMDDTVHTIHGGLAVEASRGNEAILISLHSKRLWSHCDVGLTLAVRFNMSQKVLRQLIQRGAQPSRTATVDGKPAILWAISYRRLDVIRVLLVLDQAECLSATDGRGRDVLFYAMRTNSVSLVALLWTRQLPSWNVSAAVVGAVEANAVDVLKWMAATDPQVFLESCAVDSLAATTPHVPSLEHLACSRGYLELATWLKVNAGERGKCASFLDGCTPTQLARLFGYAIKPSSNDPRDHTVVLNGILRRILATRAPSSLELATVHSFDPWRQIRPSWLEDHFTKLHTACAMNSVALVTALASCGVSLLTPCGPFDIPPLNYAAHFGAVDVIKWLLRQGVVDDGSALRRAASRCQGMAMMALLDAEPPATSLGRLHGDGSSPTLLHLVTRAHSHAPALIDTLVDTYHADVDVVDGHGLTALVYAMVCGNVPAMLHLLQRGARLEAEYEGQSGFYYVLHLVPSDVWRCFFQAFLRDSLHGRSLHCTESCGCKSFEGAMDATTCAFCSHPFDLHSQVPLPPWHHDVSDTYHLQTRSESSRGSASPRSAIMDSDDGLDHPIPSNSTDHAHKAQPRTSPVPDHAVPYVGRLCEPNLRSIAAIRFNHEILTHGLSLSAPPDLFTPHEDEDVAQRGMAVGDSACTKSSPPQHRLHQPPRA